MLAPRVVFSAPALATDLGDSPEAVHAAIVARARQVIRADFEPASWTLQA
jgi:hypothetical protein